MKELWDKIIDGIDEKYVGEAVKAYLDAEPEEIRLIKITKTETEKKRKKSHKGLMALGVAVAAVILTGAVTLGVGLLGRGREIPVLSAPETPLYAEKYVSPEELIPFVKSETVFSYNGEDYFTNNSDASLCFFRMDEEGDIYDTETFTDRGNFCSLLSKINGIRNINELEEIKSFEIEERDSHYYILPDKRIVGINPYNEKDYPEGFVSDTDELYEADFFYCNENITAIQISEATFSEVTDYPNQKKLCIWDSTAEGLKSISDEDINAFKASAAYSSTEILYLDSGVNLPPDVIGGMPALREVRMECGQVFDMAYMQSVPHLKCVSIKYSGDLDITGIRGVKELRELAISVPFVEDEVEMDITGFEELADIPTLKELTLIGSMNTDKLSLLRNVEKLELQVYAKNLSFLNDMTSLKEITVSSDYISEFGLSSDNYTVERLTIKTCSPIINLEELKRLKAIKEVNISGLMAPTNKPRTERIISEMKELYPEAKINVEIYYNNKGVADEYFMKSFERAVLPEKTDIGEIERLLSDFREFSYGYLSGYIAEEHISGDCFKSDEVIYKGAVTGQTGVPVKWYRLASGEITTQYQLFEKLYTIFNSEGIGCLDLDDIYRAKMGELYISDNVLQSKPDSYIGKVTLSSVERTDDYTLTLSFSYSVLENGDDFVGFKVTFENTTEGLRISDIDTAAKNYLSVFPVDYSDYIG